MTINWSGGLTPDNSKAVIEHILSTVGGRPFLLIETNSESVLPKISATLWLTKPPEFTIVERYGVPWLQIFTTGGDFDYVGDLNVAAATKVIFNQGSFSLITTKGGKTSAHTFVVNV
jgi:hypothetical protein